MNETQNQSVDQGTESAQIVPQTPVIQTPAPMSIPTPIPTTPPVPAPPIVPPSPNQVPLSSSGSSQNTGMAILAYLGILIIVPFFTDAKNNQFVKFHIKQGLILIIIWIGSGILSSIFSYIFYTIGASMFLPSFLFPIIYLCLIALIIVGIINAATGKEKELPVIGRFASRFKF